jgi:hypothetical protein
MKSNLEKAYQLTNPKPTPNTDIEMLHFLVHHLSTTQNSILDKQEQIQKLDAEIIVQQSNIRSLLECLDFNYLEESETTRKIEQEFSDAQSISESAPRCDLETKTGYYTSIRLDGKEIYTSDIYTHENWADYLKWDLFDRYDFIIEQQSKEDEDCIPLEEMYSISAWRNDITDFFNNFVIPTTTIVQKNLEAQIRDNRPQEEISRNDGTNHPVWSSDIHTKMTCNVFKCKIH